MTSFRNSANQDLSIHKGNRHQYYETAVASVSGADREIRLAEARGRERRLREDELKQKIKRGLLGALVAILVVGGGLAAYLMR